MERDVGCKQPPPVADINYAGMFYNADSGLYLTQPSVLCAPPSSSTGQTTVQPGLKDGSNVMRNFGVAPESRIKRDIPRTSYTSLQKD
jgi:hypothetical protein